MLLPVPGIEQCPYKLGTEAAKAWWKAKVIPASQHAATPAMKAKYGKSLQGFYHGKPLRPGIHPGDGDFEFLTDSLKVQGYTPVEAKAIAGKVKASVIRKGNYRL